MFRMLLPLLLLHSFTPMVSHLLLRHHHLYKHNQVGRKYRFDSGQELESKQELDSRQELDGRQELAESSSGNKTKSISLVHMNAKL